VVDRGQLQIRNIVARQKGDCKGKRRSLAFPLGSELAKRLSSAAGPESDSLPQAVPSAAVRQSGAWRLPLARTSGYSGPIESNFLPGISRPGSRLWYRRATGKTGAQEDWIAYSVRASLLRHLRRCGTFLAANWRTGCGLLAALSFTVLLSGCSWPVDVHPLRAAIIATTIDDLSGAARQIASGQLRLEGRRLRSKGQLGDLVCSFNEDGDCPGDSFQKEEAARLTLESELRVARNVQEYLYPRVVPVLLGATVSGRNVGGAYDRGRSVRFSSISVRKRIGILCADVSGKRNPGPL